MNFGEPDDRSERDQALIAGFHSRFSYLLYRDELSIKGMLKLNRWVDRFKSIAIRFLLMIGVSVLPKAIGAEEEGLKRSGEEREEAPFDPVLQSVEGWAVHVDPALLSGDHAEVGGRALTLLANHLQRIAILVPDPALSKLRQVEIWIEWEHPTLTAMQYHPSRRWLVANRHDPRLTRKVHITRARALLSRDQMLKHPAVILHELAHGYHDQFLGFNNPQVEAVYQQAKATGKYEEVLLYTGRRVKHYGLNNAKEYFAEGTEAYFYRNDFFPFVRAELAEFDPSLHALLRNVWEE